MPPVRSQSFQKRTEQEGRILLAIQSFQNGKTCSIRQLARDYNIPDRTLRRRISGVKSRVEIHPNGRKLTVLEEETLKKWILSQDKRGIAPRPNTVREAANLLLEARDNSTPDTVGEKWVYNFVKRHDKLTTRFSRTYDYRRAQCEDHDLILK
jgi:transposase-like protein